MKALRMVELSSLEHEEIIRRISADLADGYHEEFPYTEVQKELVTLPEREHHEDYLRHPVPPEMLVPEVY